METRLITPQPGSDGRTACPKGDGRDPTRDSRSLGAGHSSDDADHQRLVGTCIALFAV